MTCCEAVPVERMPSASPAATLERTVAERETRPLVFVVPDMHCAGCIRTLENGLANLPQVQSARANLSTRRIKVTWQGDDDGAETIVKRIATLGFESHLAETADSGESAIDRKGKHLLLCLAVAGFAAANIMLLSVSVWSGAEAETETLFGLISGIIAVPAVFFAGSPFFSSALKALSARQLNMDVPISLAVLLSLLMSLYEILAGGGEVFFDAGVMLLFFLLIGRTLDHFMREKAASGVKSLARLIKNRVTLVRSDGSLETIALDDVRPGMRLRLLPGDRFPVDAKIADGSTAVDRSVVSGEADAISVSTGDALEAGTLNVLRAVDVEAISDARSSFLADVMQMMEAAETGKGQYRRIADKMAQLYAPAVHLLALLTFLGWVALTGEIKPSLVAAVAVLIITCPCALGLAVPVTHVVAAGRLFREGILMRNGSALERLAEVDTVFFDKTGTLTTDRLQLFEQPILGEDQARVLKALAEQSRHPASRALAEHYGKDDCASLSEVAELAGLGMEGVWNGKGVRLGRPDWVGELESAKVPKPGATTSFAIEGEGGVSFRLNGALQIDAADAVSRTTGLGYAAAILSGDRGENVREIADRTGIREQHAELKPQAKIAEIQNRQRAGATVLMVGDGLNDAPSLAAANASMAPASAMDVSRASADFVFTRPSLMAVPFALRLSKAANRIVRQNFALALAYNCIAVPLAMAGHVTPLFAAIAMSLSSLVVVANSMRLTLFASDPVTGISSASSAPATHNQTLSVGA